MGSESRAPAAFGEIAPLDVATSQKTSRSRPARSNRRTSRLRIGRSPTETLLGGTAPQPRAGPSSSQRKGPGAKQDSHSGGLDPSSADLLPSRTGRKRLGLGQDRNT